MTLEPSRIRGTDRHDRITIIGIPLGVGNFKLIPLAVAPFGRDIVRKDQLVVGA